MTNHEQGRKSTHKRLWLALAVVLILLAIVIVPPLLSVSRYKSRITQLVSASLGRPVRLSSVELRVLPRPGFVLTNLTVEEDPQYGAEPLLHAGTVTASIRLLSLWRGRLEISRISVDEASLNLVRTAEGHWNLETLFGTAARPEGQTGQTTDGAPALLPPRRTVPLPYLEATNSRINIKNGVEKLPFSLVDTDASFWEEAPGDWRIRVRGQPARTDVSLDLADTGIVRLEASVRRAAELQQMPVHLDLVWREAQLGQLSRLVIGSDPGWRGALTGELHLDGTADSAQVKTRLSATGVHRAEFAPAAPMDFDANCGFTYRHPSRSVEKLVCDSPLGDGHIRLAGDLPGAGAGPRLSVELDKIPVAAGLDALRTVRSGFGPGLEATGLVSGKINYAPDAKDESATESAGHARAFMTEGKTGSKRAQAAGVTAGPLTGSFTVEGFQLSGDGLREPIVVPKLVLQPVMSAESQKAKPKKGATQPSSGPQTLSEPPALVATMAVPAGGATPLTVTTRLAVSGYQVTVKGPAAIVRATELAHVAGMTDAGVLDGLAGEAAQVDLSAEGPWLAPVDKAADSLSGTVILHNVNWKADYLANHVVISQATLRLDTSGDKGAGAIQWDPVVFSYGPVKGTASVDLPESCETGEACKPKFTVQFGALDAAALQAAILGAHEQGTLLSELIARFKPSSAPVWPQLEGTVQADSLNLGPVTLMKPSATLRILSTGAEITGLDAGMLGGRVHGSGVLHTGDKPDYSLEGKFEKLSPADVGQLLGMKWSGGTMDADGKVELSGFTDKDLTESAKGTVHFAWRHGTMGVPAAVGHVPAAPTRFDQWTADAEIAGGAITLKQNEIKEGARKREVEGSVTLGDPPKVRIAAAKETQARR